MNEKKEKSQNRLSRQEAFQIMQWLEKNRSTVEMETSRKVIAAIVNAGMRSIPHSVYIGMRKDLGWSDRRVGRSSPSSEKFQSLEKRIEAIELFIKQFQS
jgi:hypothetical protein